MFLLLRHAAESTIFPLGYFSAILVMVIGFILWERRYRRAWHQLRARNWRRVEGRFDEGEIVTMRKGRSGAIAGYQVWLGYDYEAHGEEAGLYTLPFSGEFPTEEQAQECRKLVADRNVTVRVSPRNPKRSRILDEDVRPLIATVCDWSASRASMR
jgi:hypothetical protein